MLLQAGCVTFNRTIKELKQTSPVITVAPLFPFNRTIKELKLAFDIALKPLQAAFNRTIKELKHLIINAAHEEA